MLAVISTGGKQYLIYPQSKIKIEKVEGEEGDLVQFNEVLLVADDEASRVLIGKPNIQEAVIEAKIIRQFKDKKKIVFKYHSKTRYRKLKGHRQPLTEVEIQSINF